MNPNFNDVLSTIKDLQDFWENYERNAIATEEGQADIISDLQTELEKHKSKILELELQIEELEAENEELKNQE